MNCLILRAKILYFLHYNLCPWGYLSTFSIWTIYKLNILEYLMPNFEHFPTTLLLDHIHVCSIVPSIHLSCANSVYLHIKNLQICFTFFLYSNCNWMSNLMFVYCRFLKNSVYDYYGLLPLFFSFTFSFSSGYKLKMIINVKMKRLYSACYVS